MNKVLNVYKPIGTTPLQLIHKLKEENPEFKVIKIGYAGRLDPMAHGVLLLMAGDVAKDRDKYLGLDKEYVFEVLFGVSTDSYDILGLILNCSGAIYRSINDKGQININKGNSYFGMMNHSTTFNKEIIIQYIKNHPKRFNQQYPPYSSKTVNGKPLYWWSRHKRLQEIVLPSQEIEIYKFDFLSINTISKHDLKKLIFERIRLVNGDFRQEKILKQWDTVLEGIKRDKFVTAKFVINCSTGTYIREIINKMGNVFGTGAIALDILRTKVGEFEIDKSIKLKFK